MNKLYNLYKKVILESTEIDAIQDAMNNHYTVNIVYNNGSGNSSNQPRYCGIYAVGNTSNGHPAIRIYQISGPNLRPNSKGVTERWKTLIIDNIESFNPTKFVFHAPADELFNINGDKTLNITNSSGGNIATFNN